MQLLMLCVYVSVHAHYTEGLQSRNEGHSCQPLSVPLLLPTHSQYFRRSCLRVRAAYMQVQQEHQKYCGAMTEGSAVCVRVHEWVADGLRACRDRRKKGK